MNKKTRRKVILSLVGLIILLVILAGMLWLIPFISRESQRKVELYVNPAFKISYYDSFDVEYEPGSVHDGIDNIIRDILRDGGLNWDRNKTKNALYITLRIENGFIFPPYIGHFNPQIFFPKTLLVEIYNGKSKQQLLLKLYTWRGVFNDGYGPYEDEDFLKQGLMQAGWKEKKAVPVSEAKQSGN